MIEPDERFFSEGQGYFGPRENPATETHCNVWDWDQLRWTKVKGTAKLFPPGEDVGTSGLAQFADYLSPEVRAITVDDDVSGVIFTLYEIVTNDTHFTSNPHRDRNIDMVQSIEWACHHELDSDLSKFRNFLNEWVATRTDRAIERYLNAPERITWPDLPTPPDYDVPFELGSTEGETVWRTGERSRRTALQKGQYCFLWERPPQSRLLKKA
ncbi:hypothetical protein N7527_008517 [Penicillium freii]|uniref:Uncharacterized protein n=1 Tax=Penicillium freii TaxID=48697 RepID=A0A117NL80_PENFR|nr:hypothetical protein N7527_008517 [Penicillium freii]KUM57228.1 hypothetical protein ACN42_g9963 [Penicillium freii]